MIPGLTTTSSLPLSVTNHAVAATPSVVATPEDSPSNTRVRLLYAITLTPLLRPFLRRKTRSDQQRQRHHKQNCQLLHFSSSHFIRHPHRSAVSWICKQLYQACDHASYAKVDSDTRFDKHLRQTRAK